MTAHAHQDLGTEATMAIKTTAPSTHAAGLTESLNQVLADSYALLSLTHLAHWNVEGPGFFALHTAFQTQYEELFVAIDEIAERIRALDAYAIGGLGTLAQAAQDHVVGVRIPASQPLQVTTAQTVSGTSQSGFALH